MSRVGYINANEVCFVLRLTDRLLSFHVKGNLMKMYKYIGDSKIYTNEGHKTYKEFKGLLWEGRDPL